MRVAAILQRRQHMLRERPREGRIERVRDGRVDHVTVVAGGPVVRLDRPAG